MTNSGFPSFDLTSPSTEEDSVAHMNRLPGLIVQIQTVLNHSSITVMQEKLLLKQRSSYYCTMTKNHLRPLEDRQESSTMSTSLVESFVGPERLMRVTGWATSQVVLFLSYLEMLLQEIIIIHQNLEAFITKYEQFGVNKSEVVSAEQQLQQIQKCVKDFETRLARNIEPVTLNSLFPLHMRVSVVPLVQMSVVNLGPVMFCRDKLLISPRSVSLFWYIAGEQSEETKSTFQVLVKTCAPQIKIVRENLCLNYECIVWDLKPDTCYTVTIHRITSSTLVYERWTDTLTLKTLKLQRHARTRASEVYLWPAL